MKRLFLITERGSSSVQKQNPSDTDLSNSEDEAENAVESASEVESECEEIQSPVFATENPGMLHNLYRDNDSICLSGVGREFYNSLSVI